DRSHWFDPRTGRYLGQGGPGLGDNPYPFADNDAPNYSPGEPPTLTGMIRFWVDERLRPFEQMGGGLAQAAGAVRGEVDRRLDRDGKLINGFGQVAGEAIGWTYNQFFGPDTNPDSWGEPEGAWGYV